MKPIRLGVLAAGNIASAFAQASPESEMTEVVAIGSRNQAKAETFAQRFSVGKAFGSYQALLDDRDIDAVYIASPNSAHKEWAIKAALAGKHVLCEKPLALTVADAEEMFATARKQGVILIEAFPFRFQPQTIKVLEKVRADALGEIITFTGCFGFRMRDPANVRLDPTQGGGAIWDVGCYPINLARAVFGQAPTRVLASARLNSDGIDTSATVTMEFADRRSASIWCSFETSNFRRSNIIGTEGSIDYVFTNHTTNDHDASFLLSTGSGEETITSAHANGFALEADAFAKLIRGSSDPFMGTTESETLDNTATCVAALHSIASGGASTL